MSLLVSLSFSCAMMGPVSMPASILMRLTPVSVSPMRMAHSAGLAPRYLGSSEKWRLRGAILG